MTEKTDFLYFCSKNYKLFHVKQYIKNLVANLILPKTPFRKR